MDPHPDWHCRIGRVTRKGGATVRVLYPDVGAGELYQTLRRHVDEIEQYNPHAVGFVVVAWDRVGRWNRGTRNMQGSPFGNTTLPAVVSSILSRDVMADTMRGVLRNEE